MKFYLFPKYMEEAAKSGWIVKMLKALGVIQVVAGIGLGITLGGPLLAQALDDLHALRIQTEAYVAFETDEIKMGR